jgi:hypothetical protein
MSDAPIHRFPSVDQCIYCDQTGPDLTDEHVVPFGLGGNLILPNASCKACARETCRLEGRLLRGHWWPHRHRLNLRSRRPREQPADFPLVRENDGLEHEERVLGDDYPVHLTVGFDPPSWLSGQTVSKPPGATHMLLRTTSAISSWRLDGWQQQGAILVPFREKVTIPVNLDVGDVMRFLAKVALSYAVGVRGLSTFAKFYVRSLILGSTDGANTFVGNGGSPLLGPLLRGAGLHAMADRLSGRDLSVYVQLFRESGDPPPIYEVVVGALRNADIVPHDSRF